MTDVRIVEVVQQRNILVEGPAGQRTILAATAPVRHVEVATGGLQGVPGPVGPQGPVGVQGPTGPQGPAGAGATQADFVFASPTNVWHVTHTLTIEPEVIAKDGSNRRIFGDESFPTPSTVRIEWAFPMAGTLTLTG